MRKLSTLLILGFISLFIFYVWWKSSQVAVNSKDTSDKVFVISTGSSIRTIGNDLKEQELIRDPVIFFLYIKRYGFDRDIQAGSYRLSPSMDLSKIVETLRHGNIDIWVTIPEGLRSEEIAEILQSKIPTYKSSWKTDLKAEEGYLFPDTYLIPKDADITQVVSILKNNFYTRINSIGLSKDDSKLSEIVIIASLIEREALGDAEKPLIASVIYNRLRDGVALDIDATLQYAKGKSVNGKWWSVPTSTDRHIDSPYNTYKNPGIPPGPISNPGLKAIQAAMSPASSSYYYYLHDHKGVVHFARTFSEHNQNIQKYLN